MIRDTEQFLVGVVAVIGEDLIAPGALGFEGPTYNALARGLDFERSSRTRLLAPAGGPPPLAPCAPSAPGEDAAESAVSGVPLTPLFTDVHATRKPTAATPELDAIERFVLELRNHEADAAMAPIIKPLLAKMAAVKDYPSLKRAMVEAVSDMDHEQFTDLLARAGFNVQLAARSGAAK